MKIAVDTNVLVRAMIEDDLSQTIVARRSLQEAELVALPMATLCEFVWVLTSVYKQKPQKIADVIRTFIDDPRTKADLNAVYAGLESLEAGRDFADGVIAFDGRRLGGDVFATFDKKAAAYVSSRGGSIHFLSSR